MITPNDAPQPPVEKSSAEDAWRVFLAINDWIKHADAKIAGTLAAAGVIAGVLYNVASGLKHPPIVTTVFITTTCVMLLIAVIFAGLALRPRLWTRVPATSKIYFEHISRAYPKGTGKGSSTKFTNDFMRMLAEPNVFTREISAQVWAVAHVAASKYRWINLAQVFSLIALLSLATTAFFVRRYAQ